MSDSGARLGKWCGILSLWVVLDCNFFLAQSATARVIAGVHQDAEGPGNETRLSAKAGDTALHFQEGFLHGIFGICSAAQNVARKILHARTMQGIQALVRAQVAG